MKILTKGSTNVLIAGNPAGVSNDLLRAIWSDDSFATRLIATSHYKGLVDGGAVPSMRKKKRKGFLDPNNRVIKVGQDYRYTAEFEGLLATKEIPYIPLRVTIAEIKLLEATTYAEAMSAVSSIVDAWLVYAESQRPQ